MSFFWFGDSWVVGDELYNEVHESSTYTFAYLVSTHFETVCHNYAENSSSIPHLITQLNNARPYIVEGDVLFFGLTAPERSFVIDEDNKLHHLYMVDTDKDTQMNKAWYKYIDTVPYRNMVNCNALDLIKAYCDNLHVKCWFYNIFTTLPFGDVKLVSDDDWIINQVDCVSSEIMHVFDNDYFTIINADIPQLTNAQWKEQDNLLEKYFRPNHSHPNVSGHISISKRIIKILNEHTT